MKILIAIPILLLLLSCNGENNKDVEKLNKSEDTIANNRTDLDRTSISVNQNEVMLEQDILFNGKLKRYFTLKEFENTFGKADSIKLMSEEEPCAYIFDNEDGSKDLQDKYYYKGGSRFENSNDKMAVDEFRFSKNKYILYKGIKMNSSTTLVDLEMLFPKAIKNIQTMSVFNEGELQVIQLREDENKISDGHIKYSLKTENYILYIGGFHAKTSCLDRLFQINISFLSYIISCCMNHNLLYICTSYS